MSGAQSYVDPIPTGTVDEKGGVHVNMGTTTSNTRTVALKYAIMKDGKRDPLNSSQWRPAGDRVYNIGDTIYGKSAINHPKTPGYDISCSPPSITVYKNTTEAKFTFTYTKQKAETKKANNNQ